MKRIFAILLIYPSLLFAQWDYQDATPNVLSNAPDIQFDAVYNHDNEGNTYYCWTDYSTSLPLIKLQKLTPFGVPMWQANGITIGVAAVNKNYNLSKKSIVLYDGDNVAVIWHKSINSNDLGIKEIWLNAVNKEGKQYLGEIGKKIISEPIYNIDVNEAILEGYKADASLVLTYNSYNKFTNEDKVYFHRMELYNYTFLPDNVLVHKLLFTANGEKSKISPPTSEASENFFGKKLFVLKKDISFDYTVQLNEKYSGNISIESKRFLNNPFPGSSRIDYLNTKADNLIIGRTLEGGGQKKVIAQKLDRDLNNVWKTGGAVFGSGTGFDIQVAANSDGGAIVAWIEPNSTTKRMMAARIDNQGNTIWEKPVFNGVEGTNYFSPNKFVTDGNGGCYSLWFTPKTIGYDLTIQHLDGDGNMLWGEQGKKLTDFKWYGVYRLLSHPSGGVIIFYSATKNDDIAADATYDLYTNYLSREGEYGLVHSFNANTDKSSYCVGEKFSINTDQNGSNEYEIYASQNGLDVKLEIDSVTGKYTIPEALEDGSVSLSVINSNSKLVNNNPLAITIYSLSAPKISSEKNLICRDENLTLTGNCTLGNLLWNTGESENQIIFNGISDNTFKAICTSNECSNSNYSDSILVRIDEIKTEITGPVEVLEGNSAQFQATGGQSYSWSGPNGFSSVDPTISIDNIIPEQAGVYSVIATNSNGCTASTSVNLTVLKILSVSNEKIHETVFPNPVNEILNIEQLKHKGNAIILNQNGAFLLLIPESEMSVNLKDFPSGLYFLWSKNADGKEHMFKFLKE